MLLSWFAVVGCNPQDPAKRQLLGTEQVWPCLLRLHADAMDAAATLAEALQRHFRVASEFSRAQQSLRNRFRQRPNRHRAPLVPHPYSAAHDAVRVL